MKKIKTIALTSLLLGSSVVALASCGKKTEEPTPNTPPVVEVTEYGLTIEYPDESIRTIKMPENKMISLNEYAKEIYGFTFVGFFEEETYQTQITTFKFTKNTKIYAKYISNDLAPVEPVNPANPVNPVHTHTYKEDWSYDSENHYHECIDGDDKKDIEAHNFVQEADEKYLFLPATTTSPAIYYSHCSVCDANGTTFESGDRLHNTFTLSILSENSNIYFNSEYRDDTPFNKENVLAFINSSVLLDNHYAVEDLYIDSHYTIPFEGECLTHNTVLYIKLIALDVNITVQSVGLDTPIANTVNKRKGDIINVSDLSLSIPSEYEIVGWYTDEECQTEFTGTTLEGGNITLYAKCDIKLNVTKEDIYTTLPSWYSENKYTDNDVFIFNLEISSTKEIEDFDATLYMTNGNTYSYKNKTLENGIYLITFELTPEDIAEALTVEKYVLNVNNIEYTITDGETEVSLEGFEKTVPILNSTSVFNDYSKYVVQNANIPSRFKTLAQESYDDNIPFDMHWEQINSVSNIDMKDIDVLCIDLVLTEDITILSREAYLNSIFAYENYFGTLDLNGHTIAFNFDGMAGDTLFKNNYGEIKNGTIVIAGARNAKVNNDKYNYLSTSSALLENNYGYIHDVIVNVQNFGFNMNSNHNVDAVIGCNMPLALVEDVTVNLKMSYDGTKKLKARNPIATSNAGVFREVMTGTIYDKNTNPYNAQELKNININITSYSVCEELSQKGLVSLALDDNDAPSITRIDTDGTKYAYNNSNKFYGGSYYFDGTNYIRFNSAVSKETESYYDAVLEDYKDLYLNLDIISTSLLKNGLMFAYGVNQEYNDEGASRWYFENSYCEYGYLVPEFGMVAYTNTECYTLANNLVSYGLFEDTNPFLSNYDAKYIEVDPELPGYVIVYREKSRRGVALTNSYIRLWCDTENLNIDTSNVYKLWDILNDTTYENEQWDEPAYIDGVEWHEN